MREGEASATADKVLAVGFSVVANLGGDRQVTLNGVLPYDMHVSVKNGMLDGVMLLADRQRARYEIVELEADILKHQDILSQMTEDRARVERDHEKQQATRRVEIDERKAMREPERKKLSSDIGAAILDVQKKHGQLYAHAQAEHTSSGRRGAFEPKGQVKSNLDKLAHGLEQLKAEMYRELALFDETFDAGIATAEAEIHKAEEERKVVLANMDDSVKRFNEFIANATEKLARAQALVGE